jgi:hypothetical protein
MRLLRLAAAALVLFLTTAQTPPGFPKSVDVPALQMTGMGAPATTNSSKFQPKDIKVPALQMTGVEAVAAPNKSFSPKTINVLRLTMTGVN